jgi:integral membrane protein
MALMANNYDVRSVAGWFRLIAIAEAFSWAGLLVGMYFKHLAGSPTEVGVKIFGPVHGGVFVAFVVAALVVGVTRKWSVRTWVLGLLASIVPLGSVFFVIWADRLGRVDGRTVAVSRGEGMPNLVA